LIDDDDVEAGGQIRSETVGRNNCSSWLRRTALTSKFIYMYISVSQSDHTSKRVLTTMRRVHA